MERISLRRAVFISFVVGGLAAGLAGASQVIGRNLAWFLYATLGLVTMLGVQRNWSCFNREKSSDRRDICAIFFGRGPWGEVHGIRLGNPLRAEEGWNNRNPVDVDRVKEYMLVVKEARKKH